MPFPQFAARQPASVGTIVMTFKDAVDPAARTATFELRLLDAGGRPVGTVQGDLWPHLTAAQQNALNNFLDAMRVKAIEAL